MALPVILDCDPGHDDAIALILALASPELKVLAVTTSAGNQTPDKTLNNALRILTLLGRDDIPVAAGQPSPWPVSSSSPTTSTANRGWTAQSCRIPPLLPGR